MPSLYQIDTALQSALDTLSDNGGILTPELEAILALDGEQWAAKAQSYMHVITQLEADAEACAKEIARLKASEARSTKQAEALRDRLRDSLLARGGDPVAVGTWRLSLRKSEAVEVADDAVLSNGYTVTKTTVQPDKAAIKAAIKAGAIIEGAAIVTRYSLQVK
jgi:hypothetical protein